MQTRAQPERAREITLAAIDAIAQRGLDRVKLTDVARHAGVTTGAVTYYFSDKDALLLAAFDEVGRQLFDAMRAYDGGWRLERFLNTLPTTRSRQRRWSVWLAFCGRAQAEAKLGRVYRDFYERVEAALAQATGIEDETQARTVAAEVIATVDGIGLCATLNARAWPAARQEQALNTLLASHFDGHYPGESLG